MLPKIAFYVNRDGALFFPSIAVIFDPANEYVSLKWKYVQEKIFHSVLLKGTQYMRPDAGGNYVSN